MISDTLHFFTYLFVNCMSYFLWKFLSPHFYVIILCIIWNPNLAQWKCLITLVVPSLIRNSEKLSYKYLLLWVCNQKGTFREEVWLLLVFFPPWYMSYTWIMHHCDMLFIAYNVLFLKFLSKLQIVSGPVIIRILRRT